MRVLLVDDNALSQEIGKDMLQSLGCDLAICENGREALDALEADRYDLVLMDCHMPVMNGYQATRELRRRETYTGRRRTPVIAVTANAFVSDKQSASASGMDDFLLKPYLQEELQGMLLRWGKSRTAQAKIGV
jgi:CheY-like chemotaxis protein